MSENNNKKEIDQIEKENISLEINKNHLHDYVQSQNLNNNLFEVMNDMNIIKNENEDPLSKTHFRYGMDNVDHREKEIMKKILEKFYYSAEKAAKDLVENSKNNEYMKDLLNSEKDTFKINDRYEIKVRFSQTLGEKKNFYDIYDCVTKNYLSKDLFLFEAAEAIVKLLNRGENILGEKIRKVIFYEQKYTKHRQDAAIYKKRMKESLKKSKLKEYNLYEIKYNNSKEEALKAKKKIIDIINEVE
ncbi:MAG: hypothetical protein QXF12_02720 [Candidatus Aenigmatarchaeota archaeon]